MQAEPFDKIIHKSQTELGLYQVVDTIYDGRAARILYSGQDRVAQSGLPLDDNPRMLFGYNQRFVELISQYQAASILIIGGGAFTLPSVLQYDLPDAYIDVVEPNHGLYDIAKKYFNFSPGPRQKFYHTDGLDFLSHNNDRYDFIVIDAYNGEVMPEELMSLECARLMSNCLNSGGIIAMNAIGSLRPGSLLKTMISSYEKVFDYIKIFPADNHHKEYSFNHNYVMTASNNNADFKLMYDQVRLGE